MSNIFDEEIAEKTIKEGSTILMIITSQKLIEINTSLLKWAISKKGYNVVYVTVNKPFSTLIEGFQSEKIETDKIFIIDAVSPSKSRTANAVFIGSPKELTNISITTTSAVKRLKEAKVLVFDSISTLLVYNKIEVVKKFIRFISKEMKNLKVTFVMSCIKEMTDEKTISELKAFADEVIEIDGGEKIHVESIKKN
ncbi:MAG: ATPase domain-containing protein [archaeon]